ncbi:MAG: flavin reductase family protein [Dehalococcoidia bacterium]|jgi:flavin reductase (DIM6/NTAB) family NADH-FMN oxidoreductase RutF
MLKGVAENAGGFYQHYPRTATIVTASNNGRKNAMAVAWHCPVSFNPALYGIAVAPKRYTYRMIVDSRQFGINFMPYEKSEKIAEVGGSSGDLIDKFTEFNLTEDQSIKTDVPILKDAYAAYECRVIDDRLFGDHVWIIGEIVAVHTASDVFKENGVLDLKMIRPSLYLGGETYCTGDGESMRVYEREKYGKR